MNTKIVAQELLKVAALLSANAHFPSEVKFEGEEYSKTDKGGTRYSDGLEIMEYVLEKRCWVSANGSIYLDDSKGARPVGKVYIKMNGSKPEFPSYVKVKEKGVEYIIKGKPGKQFSTGLDMQEYGMKDWIWVSEDGSLYTDDSKGAKPVGKVPGMKLAGSHPDMNKYGWEATHENSKATVFTNKKFPGHHLEVNNKGQWVHTGAKGYTEPAVAKGSSSTDLANHLKKIDSGLFPVEHNGKTVYVSVPPKE